MTKHEDLYFGWWSYWRMRGLEPHTVPEQNALIFEAEADLLSLGLAHPVSRMVEYDISGFAVDES